MPSKDTVESCVSQDASASALEAQGSWWLWELCRAHSWPSRLATAFLPPAPSEGTARSYLLKSTSFPLRISPQLRGKAYGTPSHIVSVTTSSPLLWHCFLHSLLSIRHIVVLQPVPEPLFPGRHATFPPAECSSEVTTQLVPHHGLHGADSANIR